MRDGSRARLARWGSLGLGLVLVMSGCVSSMPPDEPWRNEETIRETIGPDVYGGQWREGNTIFFGVTDGAEDAALALRPIMGRQPFMVVVVKYTADELEAAMDQVRAAVQDRSDVQVIRIDPQLNKVVIMVTDPGSFSIEGVDPGLLEIIGG